MNTKQRRVQIKHRKKYAKLRERRRAAAQAAGTAPRPAARR
jgi:hypothetical protein